MSDELEPDIDVGDCVCLNSGGPEMCVESILFANRLQCIWFDHDRHVQTETFDRRCVRVCDGLLEPVDDPEEDGE